MRSVYARLSLKGTISSDFAKPRHLRLVMGYDGNNLIAENLDPLEAENRRVMEVVDTFHRGLPVAQTFSYLDMTCRVKLLGREQELEESGLYAH